MTTDDGLCRYRTMSVHRTSQGWVRYEICVCGDFRIRLGEDLLAELASPSAVGFSRR